jgi:eukaryotic-like serine/threonine-protein kinase
MPALTLVSEVLNRVRKSGLISTEDLNNFLADSVAAPIDEDGRDLVDRLTEACYLTPFQADRILVGKYKGFHLGGYVILDQIGSGGMGQVFLAEHQTMRRLAAIKVLPLPSIDDTVARERFVREARAAAALNHPNIVKVFDLNREGKLLYLVMEYLEGVTLQHWVTKRGQLPVRGAVAVATQIALALQHAHDCSLVHRDVKPGNIVVDRSGLARLLDLGLARLDLEHESKLTGRVGSPILGTADYLAPEQAIDSHTVDIRADIYSLGATLYFMLAGNVLFPEGRTAQKLMWQQWREPTPITELNPQVPAALGAVVHQAIAKKREDRFQTPQEFAAALLPFGASGLVPPSELITSPPKRRWATRVVDTNGTLSNFKLEFSPAQSALHSNAPSQHTGLESQLRINSTSSAPSSDHGHDTKPNNLQRTTPTILPNRPRIVPPGLEEWQPVPAPQVVEKSSPKQLPAIFWSALGALVGVAVASGLFLFFGGR